MGNPNSPPSIQHFSHPHPLELQLSNPNQATMNVMVSCSGCKFNASDTFYICKPCNYILHISCSKMAQHITHPSDPKHTLSLLPIPAYPDGIFNCNACGRSGNGFSYHCQACNIDIHTLCALMPLSINHQFHHHPLTLTFSPPYQCKSFSCDICQQMGSNHWLYRCNLCEFDAHPGCARTKPPTPPQTQPIYQQTVQGVPIPQYQCRPWVVPADMPSNMNNPNPNQVVFGAARPNQRSVQQGNGLLSNLLQNTHSDAAQQLGGTLVQSIMGGGGSGGDGGGVGGDFSSSFGN
ncbi:uncharacterized protein LOC122642258 [Telopea speciosissima]|uniref:uncharacterized protein LOC122642258 n=1 Tax=Telopea speciosissima TaxID=54955 RepID=UPI001CC5738F|nr:uncharacterized protein LOC122642258 [Telopea speciosissima]